MTDVTSALIEHQTSNGTSDLMLYGDYNDADVGTYFEKQIEKSTFFGIQPSQLPQNGGGIADFGTKYSVEFSTVGDYIKDQWIRVEIPEIRVKTATGYRIRWTPRLGYNLFGDCAIQAQNVNFAEFNNFTLDIPSYFRSATAGERSCAHNNMIGHVPSLTRYHECDGKDHIRAAVLNVPLRTPWTNVDASTSFPTSETLYSKIIEVFNIRSWRDLLILEKKSEPGVQVPIVVGTHIETEPKLGKFEVNVNSIVVSEEERAAMEDRDRIMILNRLESHINLPVEPSRRKTTEIDLRFTSPTKFLMFALRNSSIPSEWSNYTNMPLIPSSEFTPCKEVEGSCADPIESATLYYQNHKRIDDMPGDFFSLVEPYFKADIVPTQTGLHLHSFALHIDSEHASGSSHLGKINNPRLELTMSESAIELSKDPADRKDATKWKFKHANTIDIPKQTYEAVVIAQTTFVTRINGGTIGLIG